MHKFQAIITVDPALPFGSPEAKGVLDQTCNVFYPLAKSLFLVDIRWEEELYYPGEEQEMNDENYVRYRLFLQKECHKLSSVIYLTQIFSSTTLLIQTVRPFSISFQLFE